MFLSELKENQTGIISNVDFDNAFAARIQDMGFCKGEKVKCLKKAVLLSPILYNIKGMDIALRRVDAEKIEVIL